MVCKRAHRFRRRVAGRAPRSSFTQMPLNALWRYTGRHCRDEGTQRHQVRAARTENDGSNIGFDDGTGHVGIGPADSSRRSDAPTRRRESERRRRESALSAQSRCWRPSGPNARTGTRFQALSDGPPATCRFFRQGSCRWRSKPPVRVSPMGWGAYPPPDAGASRRHGPDHQRSLAGPRRTKSVRTFCTHRAYTNTNTATRRGGHTPRLRHCECRAWRQTPAAPCLSP